ncbi:MAG: heavy-metal-associated domain-containing protein [Planctomycetia bacterium]|nr:heavy-metal-associated domain-containing protein [Planctomycetia bacterium]MCC7315046.1 heavy-metal-associated domain-containing protein [Planctomycetota bacterium]OQY98894.1 MAG: hypothetical protein B6D36_16910 [Planctomycetes bacterium UTPLA1]
MNRYTIDINGMTCEHCVGTVQKALVTVPGVVSAAVELNPGRALVELDDVTSGIASLVRAIAGAGYSVAGYREAPPQSHP